MENVSDYSFGSLFNGTDKSSRAVMLSFTLLHAYGYLSDPPLRKLGQQMPWHELFLALCCPLLTTIFSSVTLNRPANCFCYITIQSKNSSSIRRSANFASILKLFSVFPNFQHRLRVLVPQFLSCGKGLPIDVRIVFLFHNSTHSSALTECGFVPIRAKETKISAKNNHSKSRFGFFEPLTFKISSGVFFTFLRFVLQEINVVALCGCFFRILTAALYAVFLEV